LREAVKTSSYQSARVTRPFSTKIPARPKSQYSHPSLSIGMKVIATKDSSTGNYKAKYIGTIQNFSPGKGHPIVNWRRAGMGSETNPSKITKYYQPGTRVRAITSSSKGHYRAGDQGFVIGLSIYFPHPMVEWDSAKGQAYQTDPMKLEEIRRS